MKIWPYISNILRNHASKDLHYFLKKSFNIINPGVDFCDNWHLKLICDALQKCQSGEIKRLIINVPPRSLKSVCVSVAFPAWLLGKRPNERIIVSSYSQILSLKHSTDCRRIMQSEWYGSLFPDSKIISGENTKSKFITSDNGYRFATSIGGTVTGEGGDFLIVDDPHNPATVGSTKEREKAIHWFCNTFVSRLNNKQKGVIIVVMQRLHPDDLSGFLLNSGGESWHYISLPAIAETKHIVSLGNKIYKIRESGDLLHANRENYTNLNDLRLAMGEYTFAAQYQQNPVILSGNIIKKDWLKFYEAKDLPELHDIYISVDCAAGIEMHNDYTAMAVIGVTGGRHYIIKILRKKIQYPQLKIEILSLRSFYNPTAIIIENASNGMSVIQDLRADGVCNIISFAPRESKITRFNKALVAIESGCLFVPTAGDFVADFIRELMAFPNGTHDDQVDTISQYFCWYHGEKLLQKNKPKVVFI